MILMPERDIKHCSISLTLTNGKSCNMYNKFIKRVLVILSLCYINMPEKLVGAMVSPGLNQAITKGNIESAKNACAEILFSTEDPADSAKVNVIISMLLFLNRNPDASERSLTIRSLMVDKENPDESNARAILGYLSKKLSGKKLLEQVKKMNPNWQATALVARYIRILNELGVKPKLLNQCIMKYMVVSEKLQPEDWGNVWKARIVLWHNALQDKDGELTGFEPLIVQVKEDALSGPIKEQLAIINQIINDLLQNRKREAERGIKKALASLGKNKKKPENILFVKLLDYLSNKKIDPKDLFKSTLQQPEFHLLTAIAVTVKKISDAKPGEIYKAQLMPYLNNYEKNLKTSKEPLILEWQPYVEKWKIWCSNDFPNTPSLKPLFGVHSRAFAIKNREKLAQQAALKLYSKLKRTTSLNRVSMSDYKKVREIFKERPRPISMNFSSKAMQSYLTSLPPEVGRGEAQRLSYMNSFKALMVKNLNFSQYRGKIQMQKKTVKGTVLKADNKFITIKSSYGTRKYKWGEIKPEQYIAFEESYIKNNIGGKVNGRSGAFSSRDATEKVLIREYRILAIFCDWYGKYPEAIKFAKKADAYKASRGAARKLLLQ